MIRIGPQPLPPIREPEQIVIDALAAIKGDVDLQGSHVRGLVEFRHPNGQGRLCEAFAIMAHLAADRNFDALKAAFKAKRAADERAASARKVELIMCAINGERDRVRAAGGTFTVSDIRPIIEKALS